jgi:hypothetical protein
MLVCPPPLVHLLTIKFVPVTYRENGYRRRTVALCILLSISKAFEFGLSPSPIQASTIKHVNVEGTGGR